MNTKEIRETSELLNIVLNNIKRNGVKTGICRAVIELQKDSVISIHERELILETIRKNKPLNGLWLYRRGYYFPQGEQLPRVEFLEGLLKFYKQQEKKQTKKTGNPDYEQFD